MAESHILPKARQQKEQYGGGESDKKWGRGGTKFEVGR